MILHGSEEWALTRSSQLGAKLSSQSSTEMFFIASRTLLESSSGNISNRSSSHDSCTNISCEWRHVMTWKLSTPPEGENPDRQPTKLIKRASSNFPLLSPPVIISIVSLVAPPLDDSLLRSPTTHVLLASAESTVREEKETQKETDSKSNKN